MEPGARFPEESLPRGEHEYESIIDGVRRGKYRFARVRAASGRLHMLIGVSPERFAALRAMARSRGVGLVLLGSRVSGPRLTQKKLDPVLDAALPLTTSRRSASATYPAVEGVAIDKTRIKEYGVDDPRTSDLSVFLISSTLSAEEMDAAAREIETQARGLGLGFPVRVFSSLFGRRFRGETDFLAMGRDYLREQLRADAGFPSARLERAYRELYATVGVARFPFDRGDAANGLLAAALLSASFALTLGFRPVIPVVGFLFGFIGRYMARFKAWISRDPADTAASNALALAVDAAIGVFIMGIIINPLAGYGIAWNRIVAASVLHTLSKGSLRLFLDKTFARGPLGRQKLGVAATTALNFILGLATANVYAGSAAAAVFEAGVAAAGLGLVFANPLRAAFGRRARPQTAEFAARPPSTLLTTAGPP